MKIYDIFFFAVLFFLIGVFLASLNLDFLIISIVSLFSGTIFLFLGFFKNNRKFLFAAALIIFIIIGAFYYVWDDKNLKSIVLPFGQKENFSGLVVSLERGSGQKLTVLLNNQKARVLIQARNYPEFNYGDLINFKGVIKNLDDSSYGNYLRKERISGIIDFPEIELIKTGQGNFIKAKLLALKDKTIEIFQQALPLEKSAFLSGIVLGERGEFSKEFKEAMAKSGTTHLVALSGYNISIIIWAVFSLFLTTFGLGRKSAFWFSILIIILFVLMTGAEASVVRAAIMGVIALLSKEIGRAYSFRNAVIFAGFLMILKNPKVLNFDVGFQLSFLAVIGLVYLSPLIKKVFRFKKESLFAWQDNFSSTLSAQLMVMPLLISYFSNFSPFSFLTNLLILSVIPITMALGFMMALIGFIFMPLALVFGWFVNIFLSYEIFIIKIFGNINIFNISSLSLVLVMLYYAALISLFLFAKNVLIKNNG